LAGDKQKKDKILPQSPTKLTQPQKKFVKAYADPKSPAFDDHIKAAAIAYPEQNKNAQQVTGNRNLEKPKIKRAIEEIMDKAGITDDMIAKATRELIEASDEKGTPEWQARAKGIDLACKIRGSYASSKIEIGRINDDERVEKRNKVLETIRKFQSVSKQPLAIESKKAIEAEVEVVDNPVDNPVDKSVSVENIENNGDDENRD
jgi:phage terminase small subunit